MELIPYKYFYYPAILYGFIVVICLQSYWNRMSFSLRLVIYLSLISVYILGMSRSKGVDHGTYRANFDGLVKNIYDPGYVMITDFLNFLNIPFELALVLFGLISVISIFKISRYFNVYFFPLFFIYFAHLFVGTDFSQLRTGLAVSIATFAFVSNAKFRYPLYFLAGSIHLTVLSFILIAEYARFIVTIRSSLIRSIGIIICVIGLFLVGKYLYLFSFLNERIDIYVKGFYSTYEGSGAPVHSYIQPLFHTAILVPFLLFRRFLEKDSKLDMLILIQLFGISTFFAFSDNGIFAYRLTSTILCLYPVLILYSYNMIANQVNLVKRRKTLLFSALIIALLPILVFRPGAFRVINSMLI